MSGMIGVAGRQPPPPGQSLDGLSLDPRQYWRKRKPDRLYLRVFALECDGDPGYWLPAWTVYEWRVDAWHVEAHGVNVPQPTTFAIVPQIGTEPPSGIIVSRTPPGTRQVELSYQAGRGRRPMGLKDYEEK